MNEDARVALYPECASRTTGDSTTTWTNEHRYLEEHRWSYAQHTKSPTVATFVDYTPCARPSAKLGIVAGLSDGLLFRSTRSFVCIQAEADAHRSSVNYFVAVDRLL